MPCAGQCPMPCAAQCPARTFFPMPNAQCPARPNALCPMPYARRVPHVTLERLHLFLIKKAADDFTRVVLSKFQNSSIFLNCSAIAAIVDFQRLFNSINTKNYPVFPIVFRTAFDIHNANLASLIIAAYRGVSRKRYPEKRY